MLTAPDTPPLRAAIDRLRAPGRETLRRLPESLPVKVVAFTA